MPPPERWLEYGSLGDVIMGTKFVAFKVPLKKELLSTVDEHEKFGPDDVIHKLKDKGKVLGLVIDVNYSDKYYHKGEFCRQNIEHEKIYAGGHLVPNDAVVYRFFDVVEKFINRTKTDDVVIGVHCTHGVNRTGYIVCRYMVERLGIDPSEAMNAFSTARGHPIERQNYIDDLMTRKHNPHYVFGDHPPVLKEENSNSTNKNRRYYRRNRRQKRIPQSIMGTANGEQGFDKQQSSHQHHSNGEFDECHKMPEKSNDSREDYHGYDYHRESSHQHNSNEEFDKCHRMPERSYNYRGDCHGYDQQNYHYAHRPFNDKNSRRADARPYPNCRWKSFPPNDYSSHKCEDNYRMESRRNYQSHPNVHIPSDEY